MELTHPKIDEKLWYFSESIRLRPAPDLFRQGDLEPRTVKPISVKDGRSLELLVRTRTEMLRQAMEDLEHSYDVTLEALGDALDMKEAETEGHSKRVTAFTIALGRALGLSMAEIKVIARGAFLHDIGKMSVPDSILHKKGRLTLEEDKALREHSLRGYEILQKIPFLKDASKIVLHQKEHFDGSGYPNGLRGNQIPLGARLVALAENFDLLTCARPGQKSLTFEQAQGEIRQGSGTLFDPGIVNTFLKIPAELWHELRSELDGPEPRFG